MFLITCMCMLHLSCDKDTTHPQQYRYPEKITIDGLERTYTVQLPGNYYSNATNRPLVIGLHGTGGSGSQFEIDYGFGDKADSEGYIAVYPDGVHKQDGRLKIRTWNAGTCCDYAMHNNVNDVKFISTLLDELSDKFHIDTKKVYVSGMSNGGMMAYRIAAELPEKIAAIASVSGSMVYEKKMSQQGVVPVLHIHSLLDTKVPFMGGKGLYDYNFPPVMEGLYYWAQRNGCETTAVVQQYKDYVLRSWKNAAGDTTLKCYLTQDGGHSWPGTAQQRPRADLPSTAINANDLIWNFFSRFSLP